VDLPRVAAALKDLKVPGFRLDQVRRAVFDEAVPSYQDIAVLPKDLRERLSASVPLMSAAERRVDVAGDSRAHKALLTL
jgi:adenine C2-methylase RlmN of 23S rRNA A2503 and tRNA A37